MRPWVMFTKHLAGWDLRQIMTGLQQAGVQGADLCVRPGYPVNPDNVATALPEAARQFADQGLSIPLITTPGDFVSAEAPYAEALFAACAEAGVGLVKLGYWYMESDGYWASLDRCRRQLAGFAKLAEQTGVRALVHNHSGSTMGLNSSAVMNLMQGFDPAAVGVLADVGHLSVVGEPYPMALDMVKEYLAAVAFKDLVRHKKPDGSWGIAVWPLGMGLGNFPQVMELLAAQGFAGPISFHCEYQQLTAEQIIHQCRIDTLYIEGLSARADQA